MTASPSALYSSAVAALTDPAGIDWSADTIKIALVTSSYTFSAAHDFFNDITNELSGTGYTAGGATLASKTEVASGGTRTYDAADPVWTGLAAAAGTPAAAIVYRDTGSAATSPLLCYLRLPGTAPDGGDYTVTLPSDGIIVVKASGLRWVDLGPMLASHANSADYDPNAQHSSISVSGNDITVAVKNSVSVDGTSEGCVYVVGDPATIVPGFVLDGTCWLAVEVTVSANPADNKQYWCVAALTTNTTTYSGAGVGFKRTSTSNTLQVLHNTSDNPGASTRFIGTVSISAAGANIGAASGGATVGQQTQGYNGAITANQLRLVVCAGCETSLNDGPHSATVRIRVAAVPLVPT